MNSIAKFLEALRSSGFSGEIGDDLATRLVGATDNSIYRVEPDAVLFPRHADDMAIATELAFEHGVPITARGGGTGTNGQSLNEGIVIDTSRHMTKIRSFDAEQMEVVVEPGVVLDQLNRFLAQHGLFFPPTVSTSSRATLGGMFATDASGKGSRRYGRMSDWVKSADLLLADGNRCDTETLPGADDVLRDLAGHRASISTAFPEMNRSLTGYNLRDANGGDRLNGVKLLAGSEGTLALTTALTLRVTPLPRCKALSVLAYEECLDALGHVPDLLAADPVAIEFLDDKIIDLAAQSPLWAELRSIFGGFGSARGFLFVEFSGDHPDDLVRGQELLSDVLASAPASFVGRKDTNNPGEMAALWETRKRSVGLLGAMEGRRVGIPFVEDAAVPPENLTRFVREFRNILDGHGLTYGMFGHADVGCVHVRPALDMLAADDRALIRVVSDQVALLAKELGGLIWGEHGKGMRGEYLGSYLPPELQDLMTRIKSRFDPADRLNPGKLVTANGEVTRLDAVPFRGARDESIDSSRYGGFSRSIRCNGNGACFNWAPDDPMCPSYKATGDKTLSPKGRATLLREWIVARSAGNPDETVAGAVLASLNQCLSCKSCTSQCPIAVDIPEMKSQFLSEYYRTKRRPLRDRLVRRMETATMFARHFPRTANLVMHNPLSRLMMERLFGLVDIPEFATRSVEQLLSDRKVPVVGQVSETADVCLVLDSFTALFDNAVVVGTVDLLQKLGLRVQATPVLANGKAAQVRGYLEDFERTRQKTNAMLTKVAEAGVPLVSLEPAVTNLLQHDYGSDDVKSLDQVLEYFVDRFPVVEAASPPQVLFQHCTEKTADPACGKRWQKVFEAAGLSLRLQQTGCCGMAGLFGHEAEHRQMSRQLFDLSWRGPLGAAGTDALATGFSCRSQAKRFADVHVRHPAQMLAHHLKRASNV